MGSVKSSDVGVISTYVGRNCLGFEHSTLSYMLMSRSFHDVTLPLQKLLSWTKLFAMPRRLKTSLYLDATQLTALKKIVAETRIPQSVLVREGIDLVIAKHRKHLKRRKPSR
jgi:hypothetical protein